MSVRRSKCLQHEKAHPCGHFGDPKRECRCSNRHILQYRNKISGPLLDRIDLHVEVPAVPFSQLASVAKSESSSVIRERVMTVRQRQRERFAGRPGVHCNAQMRPKEIQTFCKLDAAGQDILKAAITELHFSARSYDRILKVARTIADMAGSGEIRPEHVSEAIQYRSMDRQWFG